MVAVQYIVAGIVALASGGYYYSTRDSSTPITSSSNVYYPNKSTTSTPILSDMYLLAYTWSAQFCHNQPSYKSCQKPREFWKTHFTIHGLWPQYKSGGYPQYCSDTETLNIKSIIDEFGWDNMVQHWPDLKVDEASKNYGGFWQYEWKKHGTCSGLDQSSWVGQAIKTMDRLPTPDLVTKNVGKSVSASKLRNAFGDNTKVALRCSGRFLKEIYTCWTRNPDGTVGELATCPHTVSDNCRHTEVNIQAYE